MKFLVIGHLCHDVIHPVDGPEVESYGGIYYSMTALAGLVDANDVVLPIFGVNKNDHAPLMKHLGEFPTIDTSAIFKFDEPTNSVHLYYKNQESRIECSKEIAKPIPFEKIKRHLSTADGVLVNMISGFDVTLDALDNIRLAVRDRKVPIHFDFHSLTLGVRENFERYRRPVDAWRRWAFMIDTIQTNEEEIIGLPCEQMTEEQIVGHLLALTTKAVVVTRGERGASVYRSEHKKILRDDLNGVKVGKAADTTGCGDVFGAAFHYSYVKDGDFVTATKFANRMAAFKARHVGSGTMELFLKGAKT